MVTSLPRSLAPRIFLSTHYTEETERADDVRIISRGRIVATGTPIASHLAAAFLTSWFMATIVLVIGQAHLRLVDDAALGWAAAPRARPAGSCAGRPRRPGRPGCPRRRPGPLSD